MAIVCDVPFSDDGNAGPPLFWLDMVIYLLSYEPADSGAQENDGEEGQANDGRGPADGLAGGHKQYRQTVYPTFTRRLRHD